jgi:hypothetical protein
MSSVEVKSATSTAPAGDWKTLYTVPALKTAIVKSLLVSEYINTAQANVRVGILRSGAISQLYVTASLTGLASLNVLASTITLQAGDALVTGSEGGFIGVPINLAGSSFESTFLLVDGSTWVSINSTGEVRRSTDSGITWGKPISPAGSVTVIAAVKIGSSWFFYLSSGTTAWRSLDAGVTWASVAITNGPTIKVTYQNGLIFNGTVYGGLASRLTTTTDGISWTLAAAAFSGSAEGLAWSGTHWVASINGGGNINRSTDGASWSTVATGVSGTLAARSVLSNGSGTVVVVSTGCSVSTNHGATWTTTGAMSGNNNTPIMFVGGYFLTFYGTNGYYYASATGFSAVQFQVRLGANNPQSGQFFGNIPDGTFVYQEGGMNRFFQGTAANIPAGPYGFAASAAILEVTP